MTVLDRRSLEASPLADLHAIASELSIDGYRRLRRSELIAAILERQGGEEEPDRAGELPALAEEAEAEAEEPEEHQAPGPGEPEEHPALGSGEPEEHPAPRRRRGRRGGRGRAGRERAGDEEAAAGHEPTGAASSASARAALSLVGEEEEPAEEGEALVEGVVELLPGGSGFVRVEPPEPSDDDVYISAAQVKRCELVSGDRVTGPKRAPRRSERFASMIRIETINGRPAAEVADSTRFEDLPAEFPTDRIRIGSEDPTLKAIEWLTPFGRGSRVMITGPARSGKSEALRRLAGALAGREELTLSLVLTGARPEEVSEWNEGPVAPASVASLGSPEEAQNAAIESVIDQARRLAARGSDAVVLIDGLDGCSPSVARRALAAARKLKQGGSLTVIATATAPLGGETTVVALDGTQAALGRFPALDLVASGTIRPELLVGQEGADAIARSRAEALGVAAD